MGSSIPLNASCLFSASLFKSPKRVLHRNCGSSWTRGEQIEKSWSKSITKRRSAKTSYNEGNQSLSGDTGAASLGIFLSGSWEAAKQDETGGSMVLYKYKNVDGLPVA
jgi:uncharacterized protein YhjY with autotransporter beta-barrel domain